MDTFAAAMLAKPGAMLPIMKPLVRTQVKAAITRPEVRSSLPPVISVIANQNAKAIAAK